MSVDELLDLIDETLEEGTGLPFTGGKRMVDVEKLQEMLDEIRLNLPTELRQAKAIVNDRADIVNSARKEADSIVRKAEERARQLVSEESVTKAAQAVLRRFSPPHRARPASCAPKRWSTAITC